MLIHFQIRGARGWEAMGSGSSDDEDPLSAAMEDLRSLYVGGLPPGHYRYFEVQGRGSRSGSFDLGADGEILD